MCVLGMGEGGRGSLGLREGLPWRTGVAEAVDAAPTAADTHPGAFPHLKMEQQLTELSTTPSNPGHVLTAMVEQTALL